MDLGLIVAIIFVAVMLVILWAILRTIFELIWGPASWLAPVVCVLGVDLELLLFLRKISATPAEANTLHLVVLSAGALWLITYLVNHHFPGLYTSGSDDLLDDGHPTMGDILYDHRNSRSG